jgi:hypothetical protein
MQFADHEKTLGAFGLVSGRAEADRTSCGLAAHDGDIEERAENGHALSWVVNQSVA